MKLIVGLGNPGERHQRTRHNVGFMVIDELARRTGAGSWSTQCRALVSAARMAGEHVLLVKPLTLMNLSGQAVAGLLARRQLDREDMIIVLDDFHLPFGRIRIRERGSAGGHNGLGSIIRSINSSEIIRVRLGIGDETMPEDKAGFVLSDFPSGQDQELEEMIARAADAVTLVVSGSVSRAMSVFNA